MIRTATSTSRSAPASGRQPSGAGLDTAALFKQQGAIRALGTAVLAAHPGLADVLDRHGLTLDPVTGEVTELEPYNALMSKRGAQVEKNLAELEAPGSKPTPARSPVPSSVPG